MPFPPIDKTFQGLMRDTNTRITLVERRLARIGAEGSGDSTTTISVAGIISPFAGTTLPDGWLLCDGAAVSRTSYPDLFTAIGITYGAGDGSTTFNLPNLKGRFLVGLDAAQTEFNALGKTGGAKTHTHSVEGTAWVQMAWGSTGQIGMNRNSATPPWNYDVMTTGSPAPIAANTTSSTGGIEMNGGTSTVSGLPPYLVTQWMISTGTGGSGGGGGGGGSGLTVEDVRDTMATTLVAGANVTVTVDDPGDTITIAAKPPGRANALYTTAALANAAAEQTTVNLAKAFDVLNLQADRGCRVRLYRTTAQRAADAARPVGTYPTATGPDHGCFLEVIFAAAGSYTVASAARGFVDAGVAVPATITNLSGATSTVAITFTYLVMEV